MRLLSLEPNNFVDNFTLLRFFAFSAVVTVVVVVDVVIVVNIVVGVVKVVDVTDIEKEDMFEVITLLVDVSTKS